jgi:hypothetical protein
VTLAELAGAVAELAEVVNALVPINTVAPSASPARTAPQERQKCRRCEW